MMDSSYTYDKHSERYFITKCASIKALRQCVDTGIWACRERVNPPQPHEVLSSAFRQSAVILIFSVNNCHGWHGYSRMITETKLATKAKVPKDLACKANIQKDLASKTNIPKDLTCMHCQYSEKGTFLFGEESNTSTITVRCDAYKSLEKEKAGSETFNALTEDFEICKCGSRISLFDVTEKIIARSAEEKYRGSQSAYETWHYFNIKWEKQFIEKFGEACVSFVATKDTQLPDGSLLNKSRNWQELPADTGMNICRLIDEQWENLEVHRKNLEAVQVAARQSPFLGKDIVSGSDNDSAHYWKLVIEKVEQKLGKVHLACPFGSQRYNLHQPGSDIDAFIVYQAHTKDLLSFDPPKLTVKNSEHEICDYTVLELQRYCELLLSQDPRCIETLFLHESTIILASAEWRYLQKYCQYFLTRKCLDKYLGDALGSTGLKRLQRWPEYLHHQNPPAHIVKLLYIIIRLLQNAVDLVKGQPLEVFRPEGSENQKLLLQIRKGDIRMDEANQIIKSLQKAIEEGKDSVEKDMNPTIKKEIERWLLSLRYKNFQMYPPSIPAGEAS